MKQNIFDFTPDALTNWMITSADEKPYRSAQLLEALWKHSVAAFDDMTVFPTTLRNQLNQAFTIPKPLLPNKCTTDRDGTKKVLFKLDDNQFIESVGLPKQKDHLTFCLSTQVGCAMKCDFCATALMGLTRQLTCGEIIGQIRGLAALYHRWPTNLVYMGMGEPLQNLSAVRASLDLINHPKVLNWPWKRSTLSTCGWVPGIKEITTHPIKAKLAISLNGVTNKQRNHLMPVNKQFPLESLLESIRHYSKVTKQEVTMEYILIKGFNDQEEDAQILIRLLKNINAKVNIIPYNPVHEKSYQPPSEAAIERFMAVMKRSSITTTCRRSQGQLINAACGQLAVNSKRRKS